MKSNYQMLRTFDYFEPQRLGVLNCNEVQEIRNHFNITTRSNVELQNLRDFVVMYYSQKGRDDLVAWDIMSGICGVIDEEKFSRGMEV